MNFFFCRRYRQLALCLVLLSLVPAADLVAEPVPLSIAGPSSSIPPAADPESPGASVTQAQQQAAPSQQQSVPVPVGIAAAPEEQPSGVAASRPSGAAIAPAKQRRIRTYTVRIALVVGAAVAIGVVAGASLASPAKAH